jgi:plastocyanin
MTHARAPTSGNHTDPCIAGCPDIFGEASNGPLMTDIQMGAFSFGPADISVAGALGVPTVKKDEPVTFWNADTADYMWHTVTRCALPCTGGTVTQYPIADGAWDDLTESTGKTQAELLALNGADPMDFDSGALGIGTGATQEVSWEWTPTRTGTYAFWCRIHPSMRGAVRVVE